MLSDGKTADLDMTTLSTAVSVSCPGRRIRGSLGTLEQVEGPIQALVSQDFGIDGFPKGTRVSPVIHCFPNQEVASP